MVENPPANPGDIRHSDSIPGSGGSPGGSWQPTPGFLSGEPMDGGAQWPTVHGVYRVGRDGSNLAPTAHTLHLTRPGR